MSSPSAGPDRHRPATRTPGPLDALPRPLAERERQAGRGRRRRSALAVVMAGGIATVGILGVTSLGQGPVGPPPAAAVVATGAATAAPSGSPTSMGTVATPTPGSTVAPTPAPTPKPTAPPVSALTGYQWPLPHGRITLPFGPSRLGSRLVDGSAFHDGMDIATFCGDRVAAAHAGTVLAASRHYDSQMGWVGSLKAYTERLDKKHLWATLPIVVVIDDGNGFRSIYAHFHRVVVKKGQTVKAGQLLGYEGMTGRATGCHLHYGLFSPFEAATFTIEPDVAKRMKLPPTEIARIDPELVLPKRGKAAAASPAASPSSTDVPSSSAPPTPTTTPVHAPSADPS